MARIISVVASTTLARGLDIEPKQELTVIIVLDPLARHMTIPDQAQMPARLREGGFWRGKWGYVIVLILLAAWNSNCDRFWSLADAVGNNHAMLARMLDVADVRHVIRIDGQEETEPQGDAVGLCAAVNHDSMYTLLASSKYYKHITDAVQLMFPYYWQWLEVLYELDSSWDMAMRGV